MRRAASDDLAAFATLVRAHEAGLRRYLRRLAGDEAGRHRAGSPARRMRSLHQWRGEGGFGGWLRQIATRRFLDRQRRGGASRPRVFAALDEAAGVIAWDCAEQQLAIDLALARLPPRERAVALLEGVSV